MSNHNKPAKPFKKAPQGLDENKSKGQINLRADYNIKCHMQTFAEKHNMVELVGDEVIEQLSYGNTKPALDFLKIATDDKKIGLNINQNMAIQKIYVTDEQKKEVDNHIDGIIYE